MVRKGERTGLIDNIHVAKSPGKPWTWKVGEYGFRWDTATEQRLIVDGGAGANDLDIGYCRSLRAAVARSKDFALDLVEPETPPAQGKEGSGPVDKA